MVPSLTRRLTVRGLTPRYSAALWMVNAGRLSQVTVSECVMPMTLKMGGDTAGPVKSTGGVE